MNSTSKSIFSETGPSSTPGSEAADYDRYRHLSGLAVAALMFAILSLPSLIFPVLLVVPVAGIVVGLIALRSINKRSHELIGRGLAKTAMWMCFLLFVSGAAYATGTYMTEVPEGYQRINFMQLQPDKQRPELPVSPLALKLNGQRVFVKGYIYPSDRSTQLERFVLVPDMGTCCFGGQPKLTDMIEVMLDDPLLTTWSTRRRRIAGTLMVDTRKKPISGLDGVYYRLKADYLDGNFASKK